MTDLDRDALVRWLTHADDPKNTPPLAPEELMEAAAETIIAQQARIDAAVAFIQDGADPEYGDVDNTTIVAILTGEVSTDSAAQPCGDYPAPCNCDNPATHGGRKADFTSWLARRDPRDLTPEQLDYVNSDEFVRDAR